MNTLTFTAPQATLLAALVFLAGVGAATSWRQEAGTKRATVASARARFATPLPAVALSPAQWARRSFDDPSGVRLAVTVGGVR